MGPRVVIVLVIVGWHCGNNQCFLNPEMPFTAVLSIYDVESWRIKSNFLIVGMNFHAQICSSETMAIQSRDGAHPPSAIYTQAIVPYGCLHSMS